MSDTSNSKCRACVVKRVSPEPVVEVPVRVLSMLYAEGYFAEFWRVIQNGGEDITHRAAWEVIEADLRRFGLPGRYDSYEVFRTMKGRHYTGRMGR